MDKFNTSLLREKFLIQSGDKKEEPIIALSNRIVIHLVSPDGIDDETFVIRTQNMHSCARLAAAIVKDFSEKGTLANRSVPVSWQGLWDDVVKGYEKDWNPSIWCAIYHKGRVIYRDGNHHPFLDIIEQCDAANNQGDYPSSIQLAEDIFGQAGKKVEIDHDSNVALITSTTPEKAKCGIIARAATGTTTFNYTATPKEGSERRIHPYTAISVAASFLEAIQLAFQIGLMAKKKEYGLIEKYSDEDRQHRRATNRMANLNRAISNFETFFTVVYRPDRPTFPQMVSKAEEVALKILRPQIEKKLAEGKIDPKDWIT